MNKYIFALAMCILLVACTSEKDTYRALDNAGYTEIEVRGFSAFGCSDEETFRTKFRAKNPNGKVVEGVVCSDFLKAATIRF